MKLHEAFLKGLKTVKYEPGLYRWRINDKGKVTSGNVVGLVAIGCGWEPKEDAELPNPEVIRFFYEKIDGIKNQDIKVYQMEQIGDKIERRLRRTRTILEQACAFEEQRWSGKEMAEKIKAADETKEVTA